jgi:RHS repeat-associated protein
VSCGPQVDNVVIYQNDHLGTPQKLTAVNGAVVWSAKYSSFGNATVDPSSTILNNLRFPGQYYDQETGLHYNLFRYYNSAIGRYLKVDPIGLETKGVNLYHYVMNNAINWIDPFGLKRVVLEEVEYLEYEHWPFSDDPTKNKSHTYKEVSTIEGEVPDCYILDDKITDVKQEIVHFRIVFIVRTVTYTTKYIYIPDPCDDSCFGDGGPLGELDPHIKPDDYETVYQYDNRKLPNLGLPFPTDKDIFQK